MPNPTPNQNGLTKPKWTHQPTVAIRVPECFSKQLVELAKELDDREHTQPPTGCVNSCVSSNPYTEGHTQPTQLTQPITTKNLIQAIELLNESLTLKANSGGAIKQKVKEALNLIIEGG